MAGDLLTVGHSTHPIDHFLALLKGAGVEAIADVRRYPGSRRNPQFGAEALAASLGAAGIAYESFSEQLGGRRRLSQSGGVSDNTAWRSSSFQAYANHTRSDEFQAGLRRLEGIGGRVRTAIMCAEAHPSRCHRQVIADVLLARGWHVVHLLADGRRSDHVLSAHAVIADGEVSYPGPARLEI